MGTMEIESALVSCTELVAEAAVVGRPDETTGEAICAFVVLKRPRPTGDEAKKIANELRNWVGQGDRPDRQAEGHPLRRQPAEDAQRQDHAPPAALDRQGRGDHAGHVDAREPGDPGAAGARGTERRWGPAVGSLFHLVAGAPDPVAPFTAVEADGWVFVTGQMPFAGTSVDEPYPEGIEAQTHQVIRNLETVLRGIGLELGDVVQARVYLTRFEEDYAAMNAAYAAFFTPGACPRAPASASRRSPRAR